MTNLFSRTLRKIVLFLLLLLFGCSVSFGQTAPAPDFTLKDVNDNDFTLSSLKGKVVILNFWAVFCPPCREEIPALIALYEEYHPKGVEIIGISVDREINQTKEFVKSNKINYPILFASREVLEAYGGIQAVPTTFFLDRNQNIVKTRKGYAEKSFFEDQIRELLKGTFSPKETGNVSNTQNTEMNDNPSEPAGLTR